MEIIQSRNFNKWKWLIVFCLLAAAIIGNYHYRAMALGIRVISMLAIIAVAFGIAWHTQQGARAVVFVNEARLEAQRVIWPTRQATLRFTMAVVMMTTVASLVLWGVDTILVFFISYLTGLRG